MRSRLALALLVVVCVGALPGGTATAAAKQLSVSGLARKLTIGYVYIDPALRKKIDSSALQTATRDANGKDQGWRFAALATLPRGVATPDATAQAVLDRLKDKKNIVFVAVALVKDGTVTIGGASRQPGRNPLLVGQAAQAAQKAGGSVVTQLQTFAQTVASGAVASTKPKSSGGGTSWWVWLVVVVGIGTLLVLLALRMRARSRELRQRARGGSIGTARQFHMQRLDELSRRHGDLVRTVGERPDDAALAEHHETAGAKLLALRRQLPALFSPRELRTCAAELDQAQWHLECADALIAGALMPPQPAAERAGLCFFTHEHGLGTVEIDLVKPDASVATVWICPANAAALAAGELPVVSSVPIGSRMVPWPAAPTWYGAPGWSEDDLQGLEYRGREIWGRHAPEREEPIGLPEPAMAETADPGLLPPGVSPPPEPEPEWEPEPAPEPEPEPEPAPEPEPPPEPPPAAMFEELEAPPPAELEERALAVDQEHEDEVTAEHPVVLEPEHTASYDPFSEDQDGDARST